MAKKLSPWCKLAKITLIKRDLDINDLAGSLGMSRPYVCIFYPEWTGVQPSCRKKNQ